MCIAKGRLSATLDSVVLSKFECVAPRLCNKNRQGRWLPKTTGWVGLCFQIVIPCTDAAGGLQSVQVPGCSKQRNEANKEETLQTMMAPENLTGGQRVKGNLPIQNKAPQEEESRKEESL